MRRRRILGLVGTAGVTGLAGCSASSRSDPQGGTPGFEFAGVIVESLPTAERHQPLDVTVSIERDGTERYEGTHTVDDVVHGEAIRVTEAWMADRAPYAVTVSSPVHEPTTYTTARLAAESDEFADASVYFRFQLASGAVLFRPTPAD